MKKGKFLSYVASFAMVFGLFAGPLNTPVSAATSLPAAVGGKITLTENVTTTEPIVFESDVILDLAGYTISNTAAKSNKKNAIQVKDGTLTIEDSKENGTIKAVWTTVAAMNSGNIIINSGNITSTGNGGIEVDESSEITVNGGTISGQEGAAFVFGKCKLNINGGTLTSVDNFAILGNGTKDNGGYEINITGGTITGNIKSDGYIAGGIYHPNQGTLNISGGTIKAVKNGAGVVARAGKTNITGGTIEATGTTVGWVGDKKAVIDCAALAFDAKPSLYPGYTDDAVINVTGNAVLKSDSSVPTVITYGENSQDKIQLSAGTYTTNVKDYVVKGYSSVANSSTYKVVANSEPVVPTVPSATVTEVTAGATSEAVDTIKTDMDSLLYDITQDTNVATTKVSTETQEAIKEAVTEGKVVSTALEIESIPETNITTEEKTSILDAVKTTVNTDLGIASFLDLKIDVLSDGDVLGTINELDEPITITVAIPKEFKKDGRTFTVVRVHGDKVEELKTTLNNDGTVSFETDKFSTYALVYKDAKETTPTISTSATGTSTQKTVGVKTGDNSQTVLWASLVMISGLMSLGCIVFNKKRKIN